MIARLWIFSLILTMLGLIQAPPVMADGLPDAADIRDITGRSIEGHAQSYLLSCESRSAVDWAAYWGISIKERKFLNNLPRSDNPEIGFVGQPNGAWGNIPPLSYGVHAEPVAGLLREFGLDARARSNMAWEELQAEIAAGRPVIVWVVGQMWPGAQVKYIAADGQTARVARFEHTMILVAYTRKTVKAVDAYTGLTLSFSKSAFIKSWDTLGRMAIVMAEPEPAKIIDPATAPHKTYLALVAYRIRLFTPDDLITSAASYSGLETGYGLYLPLMGLPERQPVLYRMYRR